MRHEEDDSDIRALEHIRDWAHDLMLNGKRDAHAPGFGKHPGERFEGAGSTAPELHVEHGSRHPAGAESRGGHSESRQAPIEHETRPAEGPEGRGGETGHGSALDDDDGDEPPRMSTLRHYSFHSRPKPASIQPVSRKGRY